MGLYMLCRQTTTTDNKHIVPKTKFKNWPKNRRHIVSAVCDMMKTQFCLLSRVFKIFCCIVLFQWKNAKQKARSWCNFL